MSTRTPFPRPTPAVVRGLAEALGRRVRGEVRFDDGSRALYATDASNYRQVPIGVVLPRDEEDAVAAIAVAREFGAPVLSRGAGTSLAGQCCNVAVVIDFSRHLDRVLAIDPARRLARVQPGCVLDTLRDAAAPHGLTFGPDPATHSHNTLGGMIGNDSCGVHSVMAAFAGEGGTTADNVEELEIATWDGARMRVGRTSEEELAAIVAGGGRRGAIYAALRDLRDRYADEIRARYPPIPRRISGYNLPHLLPEKGFHVARALVGSEGTCVAVLEATAKLIPSPAARSLVVLGFEDVFAAADAVPDILERRPIGLEGVDDRLVADMDAIALHRDALRLLPPGRGWLFVEFGGATRAESDEKASALARDRAREGRIAGERRFADPEDERRLWHVRESGLGATAHVPGKRLAWEGWEDSAVPPARHGAYLRELRALLDSHGYRGDFYGHFGEGCVHTRVDFDLETPKGVETFRRFLGDAARLVVSFGGSLSGEHGDGQSRAELLPVMFGERLVRAFREFKTIWDPENRMNPGKVVDAFSPTENLRLSGPPLAAPSPTRFRFAEDGGSFPRAVLRCVGVGACRRTSGGTMCPSWMVTREEKHSTRGRARLLFEMLRGETIRGGWRSREVREALDLCLSCKGCKSDCPVHVDMAAYKAEFLSHYWAGRLRPRAAWSMGLLPWTARWAAALPGAVNFAAHAPGLSAAVKLAAGIAPEREIPRFAARTFVSEFRRDGAGGSASGAPRVVLFPDTFTNHFQPEVGRAAVSVLRGAGFGVEIPDRPLCCGRPLYDFGMLDLARRKLRSAVAALAPAARAGIPILVLEPGCASVFRDELRDLLPDDDDARSVAAGTVLLSELLARAPGWRPPARPGRAIVQAHCHHASVLGFDAERSVLAATGIEAEVLDSGCCGMAGAFGYERGERYRVSVAAAERVLLPAVRAASAETVVLADGFSCREQIRQGAGRRALHLAELLADLPEPAR
ncbi:MAG TPA: FAD-binding and (Fe-S)-binding domain-containing protein [Thermoanaerobaculia bacterium]|nr:FAD-binding and (Fe-S)-binding domain-containing protein [Thermoanaerobaculia bacterium]